MQDSLAWLRAHLLSDTSQLRPSPVRIFVVGGARWRDLPATATTSADSTPNSAHNEMTLPY